MCLEDVRIARGTKTDSGTATVTTTIVQVRPGNAGRKTLVVGFPKLSQPQSVTELRVWCRIGVRINEDVIPLTILTADKPSDILTFETLGEILTHDIVAVCNAVPDATTLYYHDISYNPDPEVSHKG